MDTTTTQHGGEVAAATRSGYGDHGLMRASDTDVRRLPRAEAAAAA